MLVSALCVRQSSYPSGRADVQRRVFRNEREVWLPNMIEPIVKPGSKTDQLSKAYP